MAIEDFLKESYVLDVLTMMNSAALMDCSNAVVLSMARSQSQGALLMGGAVEGRRMER